MKIPFSKIKAGQRLKLIKKLKGNDKQEFVGIVRQTEFGLIVEADPSDGATFYILNPETIIDWDFIDFF